MLENAMEDAVRNFHVSYFSSLHLLLQELENEQGKTPFEMTGYYDKIFPLELREYQARIKKWRMKRKEIC